MARKLKVYSWIGWRNESRRHPDAAANGGAQTHEILAAYSIAEVCRRAGLPTSATKTNTCLGETGNERDIAKAMSDPGTIFWVPINGMYGAGEPKWVSVPTTEA